MKVLAESSIFFPFEHQFVFSFGTDSDLKTSYLNPKIRYVSVFYFPQVISVVELFNGMVGP